MMLDKIIKSCKYVVKNSKSVKINEAKLDEFIETIKNIKTNHWLSYSPYDLLDLSTEKIINFLLVYESIDFSFWGDPKWTIDTDDGKEELKGNVEIPLFEERYNIIKNVSKIVNEEMDGNFYEFIKDITIDTELFEVIVNYFQNFKDERIYKDEKIYFYKLAQLLTSDILHIRELKENIRMDYSHLIGCADYKIPQVMRGLGILEYNDKLANIIDNKKEIKINSEYEVEIRANMLVVIDLIKEKLKNKVCSIDINDYIWSQGRNKNIELKPYHLTRNTNY